MKLSDYTTQWGARYETTWRWFRGGKIQGRRISMLVVEHKDCPMRFGFRYFGTLPTTQGRVIEVVNQAENGTEDLLVDLTAIIPSFCARLSGHWRAKRQTEALVRELEARTTL